MVEARDLGRMVLRSDRDSAVSADYLKMGGVTPLILAVAAPIMRHNPRRALFVDRDGCIREQIFRIGRQATFEEFQASQFERHGYANPAPFPNEGYYEILTD